MIYRLTIYLKSKDVFFEKYYTDESELCRDANTILSKYEMNDGCTFQSIEDEIAANATIAQLTGDAMGRDHFIEAQEWQEPLLDAIQDNIYRRGLSGVSEEDIIKIGEMLGLISNYKVEDV